MTSAERRAGAGLSLVFGLRLLGLFLILPVFAVHAREYVGGSNLVLVGLALGAYGLTQALLQVPFGMASDRWGRKRVIYAGLALFAAGSFLAASAHDIWTAIAGRSLQGAGAISSVVIALAADLTSEAHRTKVMAMIGSSIGFAFALALVAGPALYRAVGMAGLFILVGVLSILAAWVVAVGIPEAPPQGHAADATGLGQAFAPELLRLDLGIFVLHMAQMAMFVVVPPLIVDAGLPLAAHWKLYLPVMLASFVAMVPLVIFADRRDRPKPVLLGAIALLVLAEAGLAAFGAGLAALAALLLVFFVAFNVLEALLPSLVSRLAPARVRGAAVGVYNTAQTLGLFCGGLAGGWLAQRFGARAVFGTCAALALGWLVAAASMRPPAPRRAVNAGGSAALGD
ncbi:MAG TPA: MFS transporter [Burkholderiales bacterium]|nr:MFS transporter [Burkholderiales bacterium]